MSKNNNMSDKTRATIAQAMQDSNIVEVIKAVQKGGPKASPPSEEERIFERRMCSTFLATISPDIGQYW
jgi:hypothetical protein